MGKIKIGAIVSATLLVSCLWYIVYMVYGILYIVYLDIAGR